MSLSHPGMLGTLLKQFRLAAALSQEELAARSKVSARAISDIERGQRTTARFETVRLLARALELSEQDRDLLMEAAQSETRDDAGLPDTDDAGQIAPRGPTGALPIQPTRLIGREAVLAGIRSTIVRNPGRLVTLTGPGGVGKTRLAIEAASQMASSFEDGVAYVSLAPVSDPALVPSAIAQALGISVTATSLLERLADFLQSRQLLLVLDNFEHVVEAAPGIAALMAVATRLSVLVTSRVRLHLSAELEYPVPALDLPAPDDPVALLQANESVRLFSDRARAIDPGFALTEDNAGVIATICRRLDGLPLGIELVAPRLKMLPVTEVLRRLDHQLPLLTGGSRDMPERQQSMRNSIAWSYNLLGPGEQQLLRWMSVFVGGFSLEAAEATGIEIGMSPTDIFEMVYSLVDNALVQTVPGSDPRFRMLETIREFGLEQLAGLGELDGARMFHARHFLAFAARDAPTPTEPEPPSWIRRLAAEQDNLMAAFDHLCEPATSELCLQFAVAYGPYLALSGPIQESWLRLRRAIEISSPEPNITMAHALFWASNLAMYAGETGSATALCQEAINVADHLNDPNAKAAAIHSRAWHEEMQEHWETASQLFEQAFVTWEETDNAFMQAQALMLLGGHAYVKGDLDVARSREEKAAALFEHTAGPDWRAGPHWYLGFIAVAEGRIADAARSYQLSLKIWLESDTPTPSCFKALVHLADIAVRVSLFEGAARMLGAAGKVMHDTGAVLFPFDEPAFERAEEASRDALGVEQYFEYRDEGWRSSPDDWLREARVIVTAAQNTSENSGKSEAASEWSPSHSASAKQGL